MGNEDARRTPPTDQPEHAPQSGPSPRHDPYARRSGYATAVDGRTDVWTAAMVAGVLTGFAVLVVSGLLHVPRPVAYPVALVLGLAVWSVLRARRRAADRRAGHDPDEVTKARVRATAEANHGRRFFVAPNPVAAIVMGAVFLGIAVVAAVGADGLGIVVAVVLAASALFFIVQGVGTLVLRRRDGAQSPTGR